MTIELKPVDFRSCMMEALEELERNPFQTLRNALRTIVSAHVHMQATGNPDAQMLSIMVDEIVTAYLK